MIQSYRDLDVWKKSIELTKKIYVITKGFPAEELYGLTSQMRRAAVSVASNIAEGKTRQSRNDYARFLYMALGSIAEIETQIIIAKELKYINNTPELDIVECLDHIARMLRNLIKSLQGRRYPLTSNQQPITANR